MSAAPGADEDAASAEDSEASTNSAPVPYHRLAADRGKRVLVEPLVVIAGFVLVSIISFAVAFAVAGTTKLEELDRLTTLGLTLGGLASLIPIAMLAARAGGRPPGQLSSIVGRLRWRWLVTCLGVALFAKVISLIGYGVLHEALGSVLDLPDDGDDTKWVGWAEYLPMLVLIVLVVPLQAAGEEYVMRGTLVQTLGAFTRSPWLAILMSGVVFSLIHMTNIEASAFIFAMGVVTAWLTIKTGGLEAGIAEHAINNLVIFVIGAAIAPEQFDQVDLNADAELGPTISQTAGLLLYAALVMRRYRRSAP